MRVPYTPVNNTLERLRLQFLREFLPNDSEAQLLADSMQTHSQVIVL